ncbi:hypothetical protein PR003_g28463 [Phytophthora rubi]|uniref:Uncharacterized protein n=1 Tax=Phytophthora rubi TaxID=129364 RepID=A0A6A4BVD9_9STRA|nr:hypothetical protein PR003_g28463 [Phytophthora rubi]
MASRHKAYRLLYLQLSISTLSAMSNNPNDLKRVVRPHVRRLRPHMHVLECSGARSR